MDVVNETITTKGRWLGPKPGTDKWENPWTIIGYDISHPLMPPLYIKMAFEIATQYAPNTKLIINQHGGMQDTMWLTVKDLGDCPYSFEVQRNITRINFQNFFRDFIARASHSNGTIIRSAASIALMLIGLVDAGASIIINS